MHKSNPSQIILGLIIFAIGAVLGIILITGSVVANLESTFYGFVRVTKEQLPTLQCPVFITPSQSDKVTLSLTNNSNNPARQVMHVEISSPGPFIQEQNPLVLQPGETQHFDWTLTKENVDLKRFIFISVLVYDASGSPRQSTCGMLYLNIPLLSGRAVLALLVLLSGILMVGGYSIWTANNQPLKDRRLDQSRAMKFLGLLILAGMFVSFQGWWLFGGLLLVMTVLMLGALMFFLMPRVSW
jgi:hypothetical protein